MPLTPTDVANKQFRIAFRGYSLDEVDAFLDEVENELSRLLRDNAALKERAGAPAAVSAPAPAAAPPQAAPAAPASMEGQEAALRTLLLAQRTADEAIAEARAEADQILSSARQEAERTLAEAKGKAERIDQDVAARIQAATGDLDARRRALESRIEELRTFEREYRTRLKAYLENQLRDLQSGAGPDDGGAGVPAGARSAAVGGTPGAGQPQAGPQPTQQGQTGPQAGRPPQPAPQGSPEQASDEGQDVAEGPPREADAPSALRAVPPLSSSSAPVGPFTVVPQADRSGDRGSDGPADR